MKRILVLCEGQTEETFIRRILAPHMLRFGKTIIPTCLVTKKLKSGQELQGGVASYHRIRRDVMNLLRDSNATCVTTMLDYYGLPDDFPGKSRLRGQTPYDRVAHLEEAFDRDIGDKRFRPFLVLHEFESLLFVEPSIIIEVLNLNISPDVFGNIDRYRSPEEINEGQNSHPSARIKRSLRSYRKALHGPLTIERIGLERIRSQCPHFDAWLRDLEAV